MVGRPYLKEFRKRVVEEVRAGSFRRGAGRRFKVAASTAIRWQKEFEETGGAAPAPKPRKGRSPLKAHAAWLLALIGVEPDLNPIEMAFAQLKANLRRAAERTVPALWHRPMPRLDLATGLRQLLRRRQV